MTHYRRDTYYVLQVRQARRLQAWRSLLWSGAMITLIAAAHAGATQLLV